MTDDVIGSMSDDAVALTRALARASDHYAASVSAANRAALAALGFAADGKGTPVTGSVAYDRPEWTVETAFDTPGEITVGDTVRFSKRLTDADVEAFADASGDTNRLHLDDAYAERTRFGGRIAHGVLVTGLVSAALARFPGTVIYLSQDATFVGPVPLGATPTAVVEVLEEVDEDRFRLSTDVVGEDGDLVVEGEAAVMVDPAV